MRNAFVVTLATACILNGACFNPTHRNVSHLQNGPYDAIIINTEYIHSHQIDTDVCIVPHANSLRTRSKEQCFLHGYDFSHVDLKWLSSHELSIHTGCGVINSFHNHGLIRRRGDAPLGFRAVLSDDCTTKRLEKPDPIEKRTPQSECTIPN